MPAHSIKKFFDLASFTNIPHAGAIPGHQLIGRARELIPEREEFRRDLERVQPFEIGGDLKEQKQDRTPAHQVRLSAAAAIRDSSGPGQERQNLLVLTDPRSPVFDPFNPAPIEV